MHVLGVKTAMPPQITGRAASARTRQLTPQATGRVEMPTEHSGAHGTTSWSTPRSGRHRAPQQPSSAGRVLATTGVVTAVVGSGLAVTAGSANAATADDFARLRQCESGGNYAINTGNGFYGAYQFDTGTWHGLGYPGLPSAAPPAMQDEAAYKLYDSRGWSPWPACSRKLGLGNSGPAPDAPSGSSSSSAVVQQTIAPALTLDTARQEIAENGFSGTLSTEFADEVRADAMFWQSEMRDRRFVLAVDGKFGPESQGIAQIYGYLSRVDDGAPGVVGENLWNATVSG
jgi:hypothetical protein